MRRDTAGLAGSRKLSELGDWGERGVHPERSSSRRLSEFGAVTSCAGSLKAVAAMPPAREFFRSSFSIAAMLRSILCCLQGVIADFGDDAGFCFLRPLVDPTRASRFEVVFLIFRASSACLAADASQ
jgi:hypothetical protein